MKTPEPDNDAAQGIKIDSDNSSTDKTQKPFNPLMDWRFWRLEFTRNDMNVLPNGNHNFSPLEYWYPGAVLSNPDNGGFSALEPVTLAIHGESTKWLRYHLNSLDITNPEDPGRPFIYLPIDLWTSYETLSPLYSYTHNFGLNWKIQQNENDDQMLYGAIAGFLGGDTWIPANSMDREPAQSWGASYKRRSMAPSPEGGISSGFSGINRLPARVFYEGISHQRTFTTLNGYESGNRNTIYLGQNITENLNSSVLYQHLDRDHFGIETGNKDDKTLHGGSDSVLFTMASIDPEHEKFSYGVNAGYAHKKYSQNNKNPVVLDLEDEIVYGKIPEPSESHTWFAANNLNFNKITRMWIFDVSAFSRMRVEGVHKKNLYVNNITAHTFNHVAYDVTIYDNNDVYSQYLIRENPEIQFTKQWQSIQLEITAGGLFESGFSSGKYLLTRFDPTAGIKLFSNPGNKWEVYTGIQHDAIPVSSDELMFLNPDSPSGGRYSWTDSNGNGIPEAAERGTLYNKTGGKYHTLSKNMKYPTRDELYFGIAHNFSKKWRAMISVQGKRYTNLYNVEFDPSVNSGYSEIARGDVAGGVLYNRSLNAMGKELYMLTNSTHDGYHAGIEIQLLKKNDEKDPWFAQLGLGTYYSQAYTISGNGPDYNDMGRFAESSADPNKQLHNLAVTDGERGYLINILFGFNAGPLTLANTVRYRDGEPFGHMVIAQGLNQGPVIIQNQNRSQPPDGVPRYTFALTWDVRLALKLPVGKTSTTLSFDVYNLLDSRSELYEYTLPNERYRDPIETVTGRSYRLMLHMYW
ncbi:MAG: hypothetical protein OEV78_05225 [Spirochaetia bacterium]|nr:hypothetical protein [Spirochaetia bacterium]